MNSYQTEKSAAPEARAARFDRFDVPGRLRDETAADQLNAPAAMKNVSCQPEKSRTMKI
jgi:hypothetical protein